MAARLAFWGAYTIWSAGDDAPLTTLNDDRRFRGGPHYEPNVVIARHPNSEFDKNFGVRSIQNIEHPTQKDSQGRWFVGLNPGDDKANLFRLLDHLEQADFLILGAGNFVNQDSHDLFRGPLSHAHVMAHLASVAKTPVMLYGINASSLHTDSARRVAQWLLDHASILTFRDSLSVDLLEGSGIDVPSHSILPDPALGARPADLEARDAVDAVMGVSKGLRLAVAPRWTEWNPALRTFESTLEIVNLWLSHHDDADVLIVPQCTYSDVHDDDDRTIARALRRASVAPERVFFPAKRLLPWAVEGLYSSADVALAVRLHGAVFASRAGLPTIGLSYREKVKAFFSEIKQDSNCFSLPVSPRAVFERLIFLLDSREAHSKEITKTIEVLTQDVKKYGELLSARLEGRPQFD